MCSRFARDFCINPIVFKRMMKTVRDYCIWLIIEFLLLQAAGLAKVLPLVAPEVSPLVLLIFVFHRLLRM